MERIYLDHAATTPLCEPARSAMHAAIDDSFGNPSSLYAEGRSARNRIDQSREILSRCFRCEFGEVHFVSSGTEACNLALLGLASHEQAKGRKRVLMSSIEHHAVLHCEDLLGQLGYTVEWVRCTSQGIVDLNDLHAKMADDVLALAIMHANNELGTIQPVQEASLLAQERGARVIVDAVQTFGSLEVSLEALHADILAVSGHKVYGPKGTGALVLRGGVKLNPLSIGGGQERELRAGTENVIGIIGFGAAVSAFMQDDRRDSRREVARNVFRDHLNSNLKNVIWSTSDWENVLSGHCHVRLPGCSAESLLVRLDRAGVSASAGAACSSGAVQPSHVLLACGLSEADAKECIRFTLGWHSTVADAQSAAERVVACVNSIRELR